MTSISAIVFISFVASTVQGLDYDPDDSYYNDEIGRYARGVRDLPLGVDNIVSNWQEKSGRKILQGISSG